MSYVGNFERLFMRRTLEIVKDYCGDYDATLLLNCLLGLLVVPKETCFESIPEEPIDELQKWGISPSSIISTGNRKNGENLRGLVHSLRNSVSHFRFEPYPKQGVVKGFEFRDMSGFHAKIALKEMHEFVEKLSDHIQKS